MNSHSLEISSWTISGTLLPTQYSKQNKTQRHTFHFDSHIEFDWSIDNEMNKNQQMPEVIATHNQLSLLAGLDRVTSVAQGSSAWDGMKTALGESTTHLG